MLGNERQGKYILVYNIEMQSICRLAQIKNEIDKCSIEYVSKRMIILSSQNILNDLNLKVDISKENALCCMFYLERLISN